MKKNHGLSIRFTHFPLHPETPEEGRSLEDLFKSRDRDLAAMNRRMQGLMAQEGLPYRERTMTYNSRLAQEFFKWAESRGKGEVVHSAIFRAYFAEGKNIGKPQVLLEVAQGLGLPAEEGEVILENRSFKGAVDEDWLRSARLGVTGVPTFLMNGFALVGAHPYGDLERLVHQSAKSLAQGRGD